MADEQVSETTEDEANQSAEEGKPKSKKKKLLLVLIILLLVIGAGGGAFFFLNRDSGPSFNQEMASNGGQDEQVYEEETAELDEDGRRPPLGYMNVRPSFLYRFTPNIPFYIMKADVVLVFVPENAPRQLGAYSPILRHEILNVLHQFTSSELRTVEGRKKLREDLKKHMKKVTTPFLQEGELVDVFFTSFVMQ